MRTTTTIRSWSSMGFGLLFAGLTSYVLLEDVLAGAPFTTTHLLSIGAIVGAIAAGHRVWPVLRSGQLLPGLGLLLMFAAATVYVVIGAGVRNTETAQAKAAKVEKTNAARTAAATELTRTRARLDTARAEATAAHAAAAAECRTGKGKKCEGTRATAADADQRAKDVEAASRLAQAQTDLLGPAETPHTGYRRFAALLAIFGAVADVDAATAALVMVMPYLAVLIAEIGTIVFLHLGIGHRPASRRAAANDTAPPPSNGGTRAGTPDHPVIAALRRAGRPLSNDELAHAMGVSKGEASKRRREVAGRITEAREGRELRIRLAA